MRGMSVVLFEARDLSSGTSSKSSRLIHGGLRYLDTHDFGLVYKDLHEREKLLHIAPHLVRPMKFVVPYYNQSSFQRFRLRIGMILYDLLSTGKSVPSHRMLAPDQLLLMESSLLKAGLQGGALFYDCQASFVERISIENAVSATEHGAKIFTYTRVRGIETGSDGTKTVEVEDVLSKERFNIRVRCVVNATGPWADLTLHSLEIDTENRLRTTKGIHLVLPRLNENAVIVYSKSDNRLLFVIPWLDYSLIGTTDTDYSGDPAKVQSDPTEVAYLVRESAKVIPGVTADKILFTYAGVRPLVCSAPQKKESVVSRNYRIIDHSSENGVFVSVLGVKITSYRQASEDATDLVSKKLKLATKCMTAKEPLPGARGIKNFEEFATANAGKLKRFELDEKQISYLLGIYGTRISELVEIIDKEKSQSNKICQRNPDVQAQYPAVCKK